ncbi:MAG: hypothetical protein HY286_12045 [Planctomycetes bacterium]|nr:hypothetical protein [Planctomycetota bacterium]
MRESLVEQIEIEKKQRSSERPPLLASPLSTPRNNKDNNPATDKETALLQALDDEIARQSDLKLPGIAAPYYVEYCVTDRTAHDVIATQGSLIRSEPTKNRTLQTDVRVGSYELDNSNFTGAGGGGGFAGFGGGRRPGGGGAGGAAALPVEDDYTAIRQAAWLATDSAYKNAVETFTQKSSYLEGRGKEQRPADFAKAEPVKAMGAPTTLEFDAAQWEERMRRVSARFLNYKNLVDSGAEVQTHADNDTFFTTEGTRERFGARRATLLLHAEQIAEDGQRVSDRTVFVAETAAGLPSEEKLLMAVDELAARVAKIAGGTRLKEYSGPVLFDGLAAPQVFQTLLARGVVAQPAEVGGGRRRFSGGESLDKLMGKRILPASFHVWDDPRSSKINDAYLTGNYSFDDDGIAPQKVEIVTGGKLVGMVSSRTPTELNPTSNGHGRGGRASIGCMFVESSGGLAEDALKQKLIATAKDQGLKYAIRVSSLGGNAGGGRGGAGRFGGAGGGGGRGGRRGGAAGGGAPAAVGGLQDPLVITKIFVDDGHEEYVRACEFDSVSVNSLKDIVAAGSTLNVWNGTGGAGTSVIAPAIVLETVNIYGIESESEKKPALPPPSSR